mmetsp:Transcript_11808/g.19887  ORF Transcript_11808/g.19887 Transcript_11808/m.19887 type:complete len:581 (-) Transcript_11808:370-2112(-)|eukprot:CAMPEP_0119319760 /NCGR_PEP_ID=MMETSP1333-20130426/50302_1 /TAXON_ID=418940 /ORGANISM="Scyphosphaera apsteinii, Strain RCC1455" /LENGTH=580 /DNA_ID=CAMNT_0007326253 /DNA_START=39 /DNA_END=1781 /DNA_ORIENTATION=-
MLGLCAAVAGLATDAPLHVTVPPESFERAGWILHAPAPSTEPVTFSLVMKQRNMELLKRRALAVNTPGDADYGSFMEQSEIDSLTMPIDADVRLVEAWLLKHALAYTLKRETFVVQTSIANASVLLGTTFFTYHKEGRALTRAADYSLPASIADVTATIFGVQGLPMPRAEPILRVGENASLKMPKVTPSVIAATYSVGKPYVDRDGTNRQAVAEFQGEYMKKQDLEKFFKHEVPHFKTGDDQVTKFIGVPYKKGDGVEADLDIQFIMGVAPGVKTYFFEWPEMDFCADLHHYTSKLLDSDALVHSISYGWQGSLKRLNCKTADIDAVDANWAKLAAKGISVMISSGDSGSGYTPKNEDGGDDSKKFALYPSWPASSPWVTAVGATRFIGQKVGGGEMASDQFGSGGGFSKDFDQSHAKWQSDAVKKYVAMGPKLAKFPPEGSFPPTGRATPDISALGEGFQVYVGGEVQSVGGTSASSPLFAGLVSLLNEARLKARKPQMGFLNPFLYANPTAFYDVVKGTNALGRGSFPSPYGFAAAPGWDPATGLGTPHFDKLLAAAMKAVGVSNGGASASQMVEAA